MPELHATTLLGRKSEESTLRVAVDAAVDGRGSVWLLRGQPGIGKTRLATDVRLYAAERGANTAHAFSWDQGGAPAFWPWLLAAQTIGAELGAAAPDPAGLGSIEVLPHDDRDRFHLFADTLRYFRRAAQIAPVVIVLDDLHEADLATILLLRFIAEGIADIPMMVIGTYRPADLRHRPDLGEVAEDHLAHVSRAGRTLDLSGLEPQHVQELMRAQLDDPQTPLDRAVVARVVALTEGNPLFVLHLAPTLLREQVPDSTDVHSAIDVPEGIRRVIHQRLEWLDPDLREVLSVAAVIGPDVELSMLSDLCGRRPDQISTGLSAATEYGFVALDNTTVQFRHPLIREVLLAELASTEATELHARVADWLVGHTRSSHDEIAHHLTRSAPERAVEAALACTEAAAHAVESLAFENAIVHLRRGLAMLDRVPDHAIDHELVRLRTDLLIELGRILWRASRRPECDQVFDEAWMLALELDDTDRLVDAALGGGFSKAFTTVLPNELAQRCELALDRIGPEPSRGRGLLLAKLASELVGDPDPTVARCAATESLSIARSIGDERVVGEALGAVLVTDLGPDRIAERIGLAEEMLDIAHRTSDLALAVQARFQLVGALVEIGDRERLLGVVAEQHRAVDALAEPGFLRHDVWFRAMVAAVDGSIELAEALADEGLEASGTAHDPDGILVWGGQLGVVRWMQGRINELEPLYRDMVAGSPEPVWAGALAWLWARNGMHAAADGQLERVRAGVLARAPRDRNWLLAAVTAGEATARAGPPGEVDGFIELLTPYADHLVPIAMGISFWGTVARPLALLHLSRGDVDEATALYEQAIAATARFGALPWLVEAQLELAAVLEHRVDTASARRRAMELVVDAEATSRRCGFVESLDRARVVRGRLAPMSALSPPSPTDNSTASIRVLGGFSCSDTSGGDVHWTSRRARLVLKLLVAARGQRVARDVLIEKLWPGVDGDAVGNRLAVAVSTIRRSLDPARQLTREAMVGADRDTVWLTDVVDVDLERFLRATSSALGSYERFRRGDSGAASGAEVMDELRLAMGLYSGPAFADEPYEDAWSVVREAARAAFVAAGPAVVELATSAGRLGVAAEALRALLDADPYDAEAHLALVELYRAQGAPGLAELAAARYHTAMTEPSTPDVSPVGVTRRGR